MSRPRDSVVRPETDSARLAAIHAASFDDAWTADAFARLLASPGCFALAAQWEDDADDPTGMILVRVAGDDCEIITIGVHPESRRHGVATLLLEHSAARALGLGAQRQVLEVGVENAPALALYASLGFAECGRRPGYYGGTGGDAVILERAVRDRTQSAEREQAR
jgi:ribosomal-protein-alanine N-acetyltransferase